MADMAAWLERIGLGHYAHSFAEAAIDLDVLPDLTEADLADLGVKLGDRKRLLKAIASRPPGDGDATAGRPDSPQSNPAAERRQLTVMFVDLAGSTELSRRLDPEDMGAVIRAYHDRASEGIRRWGGHVGKYMGDGVLAYFGWPHAHEDDAERAVRAGLGLARAVAGIDDGAGAKLSVRVGIATGPVVIGALIGEGSAQEQAVVGETPNLAARLQTVASPGGVVISASTHGLLGELFEVQPLANLELKGFDQDTAFQVTGEGRSESRFEATRGRHLTPLVGRDHELALLHGRWSRTRDGEGQVVLLSGEAGIGKSRLVRAFRERLRDEPHVLLPHYGSAHHTSTAFFPISQHLERAGGLAHDDPQDVRLDKLEALLGGAGNDLAADVVSLVAPLLGLDPTTRYDGPKLTAQRRKQLTLETLVRQVEGLARGRPVLAIYEDVHWFDPSSEEAVSLLIERVADLRVMVLVTCRPDFSPPWRDRGNMTALSLTRLARGEGAAILARLTGGRSLPPGVEQRLLDRTDGVPLFIEELTKAVLESGQLHATGNGYALCAPLPALTIPSSLHDSLMARLDRLGPVKEVAQIASVIGREFPYDLLAAIVDLSKADLEAALAQLEAAELVYRRGIPPDASFSFKHALVQDAAYQSLLRAKRQRLHARIAATLEQDRPELARHEPELLAHHLTHAGATESAIDYWQMAARRASERSAHQEAHAHLVRAIDLLDALPDTPDRVCREIDLRTAQGTVLIPLNGQASPVVGEVFARAEALCVRAGESEKLYPVLQGLWHFHAVRAELQRARGLADRCAIMAEGADDPSLRFAAHVVRCGSLCLTGDFAAACRHLDQALLLEDEVPSRSAAYSFSADLRVFARGFGSYAAWNLGHPRRAIRLSEQAMALAGEVDDPFSLTMASNHAAMVRQLSGDHSRVAELAGGAVDLSTEHRFTYYLASATFLRGWAAAAAGRIEHGIAGMRQGLSAMEATGCRLRRPYCLGLLAGAQIAAGRPEAGLAIVDEAIGLAQATGEHWRDADLHRTRSALLLALSVERSEEAEAGLTTAIDIARRQSARALELQAALDLARLLAERSEGRRAHDLLASVCAAFAGEPDHPDLADAEALLDQLA